MSKSLKKKSNFSTSHNLCPSFPNTGGGFDYYEAFNKLYGTTGEKLYKYMELDFAKSVMFPKNNPEYTDNLEYNIWKNKTSSEGEQSVGARIAVVSRQSIDREERALEGGEEQGGMYTNLKFTLCYLTHTFMIDIDLPTLRKSWYSRDELAKPKAVSRLFEHDLVDKAKNNIERHYQEDDVSIESMKTIKGVHIVGCLNSVKYPLRDMNLLNIIKNYTDPAYMTKTLLDPTRGFCDKLVEVSQVPFHDPMYMWYATYHLVQARRIGLLHMHNRTPAQRIALFRRILAENLCNLSDEEIGQRQQIPNTGQYANDLSNNLAHILISCVMNTSSSAPTRYELPETEQCKAYVLQTAGCAEKDNRSENLKKWDHKGDGNSLRGEINMDKIYSRYAVPKPFEEFEVTQVRPTKADSTVIFHMFQKLLDDCWEYSGLVDRSDVSYNFHTDLLNHLNVRGVTQTNSLDVLPTEAQKRFMTEQNDFARSQIGQFESICRFIPMPSTYRSRESAPRNWNIRHPGVNYNDYKASMTRNVKTRIGNPNTRVVRPLSEQAAALIPNAQLENPPPDRLNLTDDLGPPVSLTEIYGYHRHGAEIVEA